MFFERLKSEGLAHNSYLLGDGAEAVVVDPARDIDRYMAKAAEHQARIALIFESHRNEDYISGAKELAAKTGARVVRGRSPDYTVPYAEIADDGRRFRVGALEFQVIATPGHTDDSISIAFADLATGQDWIGVFTGDVLFVGEVGRTDFYPDRAAEVAGLLHDSLHARLLPLGDHVVVYPAHGSGSVCGAGIAARDLTTLGYERRNNPRLALDRAAFIRMKLAEHHYYPPYFRRMEAANQGRDPELGRLPACPPRTAEEIERACRSGAQLLDVRADQAIAGAHIPGSFAIPADMLSSFAGWFLKEDRPILLVLGQEADRERVLRLLARIGYDSAEGFLAKGVEAWALAAKPVDSIPGVDVHRLRHRLLANEPPVLLDVRRADEVAEGRIDGAHHIYVGQIEQRLAEIPPGPIVTYCASGRRALVAAAALRRLGRQDVSVCWGSMNAWKAAGYPVTKEPAVTLLE